MAVRFDSIGHLAALKEGGRTLAVYGSGLDVPYPPENRKLAGQIRSSGAIISEFLLGTKPEAPNFPRRNRLISGLSLGVVIVEAGNKSGALLTAQCALEQNREVFAIPGNLDSENGRAILELLLQAKQESRTTLVLVTHSPAVADRADRIITLADGRIADGGS